MLTLFLSLVLGCSVSNKQSSETGIQQAQEQGEVFDPASVEPGIQAGDCVQFLGERPCDIVLKDQNGEYFRLYDHEGEVILLDFSAGWCGPCKAAARTVQETQDRYDEYGFLYVTVMVEDDGANSTTQSFANQWAHSYGIETPPVLQGSRELIDYEGITGYNVTGWPTFYVIDREMKLDSALRGFNEEWIKFHIEQLL